jgi:hypothetical protein
MVYPQLSWVPWESNFSCPCAALVTYHVVTSLRPSLWALRLKDTVGVVETSEVATPSTFLGTDQGRRRCFLNNKKHCKVWDFFIYPSRLISLRVDDRSPAYTSNVTTAPTTHTLSGSDSVRQLNQTKTNSAFAETSEVATPESNYSRRVNSSSPPISLLCKFY